ncbi:MAG: Mov34/MPN/PAD-1 family protein [Candidatus Brocadiae bacterium]|nr:Mov34/MPN/PAD-1 family protein [Candidatus Brocadiia bacterium]
MTIRRALAKQLLDEAVAARPNEAGGVLLGYYTPDMRVAFVTEILQPKEDTRSGLGWFLRGVAGLAKVLIERWQRPNRTYYLGEWHSHPGGDTFPSGRDGESMRAIATSPKEQCPEPVLVIVGGTVQGSNEIGVWVFTRTGEMLRLRGGPNED